MKRYSVLSLQTPARGTAGSPSWRGPGTMLRCCRRVKKKTLGSCAALQKSLASCDARGESYTFLTVLRVCLRYGFPAETPRRGATAANARPKRPEIT